MAGCGHLGARRVESRAGWAAVALLLALVASVARGAAEATSACWTNPTTASCTSFEVDNATISADLDAVCSMELASNATNGWPAACTLWAECQAGRTGAGRGQYCSPLVLMQSACNESPSLTQCSRYLVLCAPQSVVDQCNSSQRITALLSATRYYQDVQSACKAMKMSPCSQCSAQSLNSSMVVVQALQTNCPNPLGTLADICLSMFMSGCTDWSSFCAATANSTAFPALCSNSYTAPAPAAAAPSPAPQLEAPAAKAAAAGSPGAAGGRPSPSPAPSPVPEGGASLAGSPTATTASDGNDASEGPCYSDPTAASCAGFVRSDSESEADIQQLCAAMPNMSGCTLWQACTGGASGTYCQAFSLLGDLCVDMPGMTACDDWAALCSTPGSVVNQCNSSGPVPDLVHTDQATSAILAMCSTHGMAGCSNCTSAAKCPDPLGTFSQLCLGMAGMAQCAPFFAMCEGEGVASTFGSLCSSSGSDSLPPMKMYLHASMSEIILLKSWVPQNAGTYVASCLAIIATAVLVQAIKGFRLVLEGDWAAQRAAAAKSAGACGAGPGAAAAANGGGLPTLDPGSRGSDSGSALGAPLLRQRRSTLLPLAGGGQARRNAIRACFTLLVVFLDYMLMLVVMTFNIGLIISAVLGFGIGALLFGHLGEQPGMAQSVVLGQTPESELDVEVSYVDPATCCNSGHI